MSLDVFFDEKHKYAVIEAIKNLQMRKPLKRLKTTICFSVFFTFLRQFVTENSENFYEGQKLMYKGCSSQEIIRKS